MIELSRAVKTHEWTQRPSRLSHVGLKILFSSCCSPQNGSVFGQKMRTWRSASRLGTSTFVRVCQRTKDQDFATKGAFSSIPRAGIWNRSPPHTQECNDQSHTPRAPPCILFLHLVLVIDTQAAHAVHLVQHFADLRLNPHHGRALVQESRQLGNPPGVAHAHQLPKVHLRRQQHQPGRVITYGGYTSRAGGNEKKIYCYRQQLGVRQILGTPKTLVNTSHTDQKLKAQGGIYSASASWCFPAPPDSNNATQIKT